MAGETFIGQPWRQPYTAKQLQDAAEHQVPIIGANGNFWRWDIATSAYVDTGVLAGAGLPDSSVTWPKLAPEARKSNPNLLDNAYFIGGGSQQGGGQFPINQRGLTEYTGLSYTYSIDRFIANAIKVKLESDGILCTPENVEGSDNDHKIFQSIEAFPAGLMITFSALVDGVLYSITGTSHAFYGEQKTQNLMLEIGVTYGRQYCLLRFSNVAQKVAAMKLELGPYQTLAYESGGGMDPN